MSAERGIIFPQHAGRQVHCVLAASSRTVIAVPHFGGDKFRRESGWNMALGNCKISFSYTGRGS